MSEQQPKGKAKGGGYRNPPVSGQFKKGQSGNPSGRRKGSKNERTIMRELMAKVVTYTINGKQETGTSFEVICQKAKLLAMNGDVDALIKLCKQFGYDGSDEKNAVVSDPLDSPKDLESRASFLERIRGKS